MGTADPFPNFERNFAVKTILVTVAAIALSGLAATTIQAQELNTTKVFYGDLNLGSASGMQTLASRIQRAASRVCPDADHDLTATSVSKCRAVAVADAMKNVAGKSGNQIASR
ncbi:UrcA family protein [Sphingosinicellaceae bacterium]|nr:UrcA family protein [Sphingosinicellaceae bacterium]